MLLVTPGIRSIVRRILPLLKSYRAKFNDFPRVGSLPGYTAVFAIKQAIETAGSTGTDPLISAFEGLAPDTVVGPISFRAIDHQATLGTWIGTLRTENGTSGMVD